MPCSCMIRARPGSDSPEAGTGSIPPPHRLVIRLGRKLPSARQAPQEAEPALRAALNGGLGQGRLTFALAELCAAQGNIADAVALGREALQLDKDLYAALRSMRAGWSRPVNIASLLKH